MRFLVMTLLVPAFAAGEIEIQGERRVWHKVTVSLEGPRANESDRDPNPFVDLCFDVTFTHESGAPVHRVAGHFAADGDAGNSGAEEGKVWRAHFVPDRPGTWSYEVSFRQGKQVALNGGGEPLAPYDGLNGKFSVDPTDKSGRDFRAHGRLQPAGHYLRHAGSGEIFLKAGADSPETLLAYADFDATEARKSKVPLKTWEPHRRDWREGDPAWKDGKGKGLIGALNYLASTGCNAFSFLTYNAGGDGDNVWPFVSREAKLSYDCSKLDQWGVVMDHATSLGLFCHYKLQETEMDDERRGDDRKPEENEFSLDGGRLGPERKLYLREMVSRFGHLLALNWNLGEENTQTAEEQRAMCSYLRNLDPWGHPIVLHTYPGDQDKVYRPLLGDREALDGVSLQNGWNSTHNRTVHWRTRSAESGHRWIVCQDEQGGADTGVPPDDGWDGYDGMANGKRIQGADDIRKRTLWGNLLGGGAGVEYYFGYRLPENDLLCEDWRSRHQSWVWAGLALEFFRRERFPLGEMEPADALVGNPKSGNERFCLAKAGELYLIYLPEGGATQIDLTKADGVFSVRWFNPRDGGPLTEQGASEVTSGTKVKVQAPDEEDWLAVLRRKE